MVSEKEKQTVKPAANASNESVMCRLGEYLFSVFMTLLFGIKRGFLLFVEKNGGRIAAVGNVILSFFKKLGLALIRPFKRYGKAMKLGVAEISKTRKEHGAVKAFGVGFKRFMRLLFGKRGLAYTLFNYALPIVCMVLLVNIVTYANSMTYALRLSVNGDFIGYVGSETVFTEAERIVQQRINYMDGSTETVTFEPTYQVEMASYDDTLTKYQLADKLLTSMDAEIEYAYGMYIGNSFYGAVVDKTEIEQTLDSLLDKYRTGAQDEVVEFEAIITYEPGLYLTQSIVEPDSIIKVITSNKSVATYYTAVKGDSPIGIINKLGVTMEEMAKLNPGYCEDTKIYVDDKFLVSQEEPFLAVSVTRTEVYDQSTDYETEYYDDSSKYQGSTVVMQDGVNGTDRVTAQVSYINGVEVRRKVINRVTVEEPTPKIVANGTKRPPSNASISNVEVGKMLWPVGGKNGGLISEMPYGYGGYYNHQGLDISASYGTPIYAAENGTVTLARWYGGYGYCVKIDHGNGIVTVYGHCSYLHVSEGQKVTQGQAIADVGSTGDSTGNHLHFEVRINGVCMNPINYLPWHERAPWCVEY